MTDDELERLLGAAFDARAGEQVDATRTPPPPRFAQPADPGEPLPVGSVHDRRSRSWGVRALPWLTAAAVVVLVAAVLALVGRGSGHTPAAQSTRPVPGVSTVDRAALQGHGAPVHIKLLNADDSLVGVGMPVIAYFSKRITNAEALQKVTTVTVDGRPVVADWYFERSAVQPGYPLEAHLRTKRYWPADSRIHVGIATQGLTAGTGMRFDDSLTLDFRTGARHLVQVDAVTHRLTMTVGGHTVSYPVSLGAPNTPTSRGIKVIMQKGVYVCMRGPGYRDCGVKYTQQLTYGGEYLVAAPWNKHLRHGSNRHGIDSSNGCTNLTTEDARALYSVLRVGDVVSYPNATGPQMQFGSGYGDWNVPWSLWRTGGIVRTH